MALLAQWPLFRFGFKPGAGGKIGSRTGRAGYCLLGPAFTLLVGITWHRHFTLGVEHSLLATVLLTLLYFKSVWTLFSYDKFRQWLQYRAARRWFFRAGDLNAVLIGLLFLFLGLAIY